MTPARSRGHWPRPVVLLGFALLLVVSAIDQAVARASFETGGAFGVAGKAFTNFKPIPKWTTLLKRYKEEEQRDARCRGKHRGSCPYTEWKQRISRLRGEDKRTQLKEVNKFINHWRYITDPVNWNVQDYWATPGEFFKKAGDCEDYAIAKFMTLRALGFDNDTIRLVAVKDLNLDVGHAVILVSLYGQTLLLDNQVKQVVPASSVHHYKPVYAANETTWWLYK